MRSPSDTEPSVLLLEPDEALRSAYARALVEGGCLVNSVPDVESALLATEGMSTDVVVSEIGTSVPTGASLLSALRDRAPDLPVIVMTAEPDLETAVLAVNTGVYRYLIKPVSPQSLVELVHRAAMLHSLTRLRHAAVAAVDREDPHRYALGERFSSAQRTLWMVYQPIVDIERHVVLGFEALLRVDRAGFTSPDQMIAAAMRLERTRELGRAVRTQIARDAVRLPGRATLFVNLLPQDLLDPDLFSPTAPLSPLARRVVLELTERSSLDAIPDLTRRVASLREMGYRIALDDLGVGYSGLASLTQLEPEIVKLDRSLIHGVHQSARRRAVVRSMVALCHSLDIKVIGEGVEREAEAEALRGLDVGHLQGFLLGQPERAREWSKVQIH